MDTEALVTAISGQSAGVTAIGGAILAVLVVITGYRLIRRVL